MTILPKEIVEEIFSRLPMKSILRFKIVSKNFYSLISKDQGFAKLHLINQSKNRLFRQAANAIFRKPGINSYESSLSSRKIKIPDEIPKPNFIVGSANGLICVAPDFEKLCFIWNPCTNKCARIAISTEGDCNILGFGYDAVSDDYKIVGILENKFQVFSLKSNSWTIRETRNSSKFPKFCEFSNGALHWLIDGNTIIAFDLATEAFLFIETPEEINEHIDLTDSPVFDHQGSLCLTDCKYPGSNIWVMKEYGIAKSWVKLYTSHNFCELVNDLEYVRSFTHSESLIWPKYLDVYELQITQSKSRWESGT